MRKIFYLKGQDVSQFNNYAELIIELAEDCLRPGAHPEKLNVTGLELYSVRFNQAARLIYSVIKEDGPYKNSIVLCLFAQLFITDGK